MQEYIIEDLEKPNSKKVIYVINKECWEVISHKIKEDQSIPCYKFIDGKKYVSLLRYIFVLYHGDLEKESKVKRTCKNNKCINPAHMIKYFQGDWRKNEIGNRYSYVTITQEQPETLKNKQIQCLCDCGSIFIGNINNLRNGHAQSCGCLITARSKQASTTHGKSYTRLYKIYAGMKERCYNPNHHKFKSYGKRGVTICDKWLNDFDLFYKWAEHNNYSDDLTIDRINVDGCYSPENCRWISNNEQQLNKTDTIKITYNDEEIILLSFLRAMNREKDYGAITARLRRGWSVEDAINRPIRKRRDHD